ncbi:hypothetical protein ACFVU0_40290, partial [Streptomyces sp. NPDC058122]|uniref:hypothetical protein n=1 Tax=Streptomyces sp. NPDC058122 TaxID=3346349 RepID=UPI0036F0A10A
MDVDLSALNEELREAAGTEPAAALLAAPVRPAAPGVDHTVPESFERGKPVTLSLDVVDPDVVGATLHYRHVD